MPKYSDFQDKPINKTLNYIHWFFMSSIYFSLCNILFILAILFFELKFENILVFFISLIPTGPALVALLSFMNKLITDKYVDTTSDFFSGYTKNFIQSIKLWFIFLIISFILIFDLKLCLMSGKFLFLILPIAVILIFAVIFISYALSVLSKYEIKLYDLTKLSIYLSLKNPIKSILNLIIISVLFYIFLNFSNLLGMFIPSLGAYLILKNIKYSFIFIDRKYLR